MDNSNEQLVTLTGYDLLDIRNALTTKINSIANEEQKGGWKKLLIKVNTAYDNPKFKQDYKVEKKT